MSAAGAGARRAAVLGAVTGARTFLAPAALALRGRLGRPAKLAFPALAAGELVGDKLPVAPPRVAGPGLVARVVSGAFGGRVADGSRGARVGAALALAGTYPSQALRAQLVARTPLPDPAVAAVEDLAGIALAASAATEPRPDLGRRPEGSRGIAAAVGSGLAAAAVGTAAMTSAQQWLHGLTGGEGSQAPAAVGERILAAIGVKVPKRRRPALNTAMHALYGTSWGLPFAISLGRGEYAPGPARGLAFGLGVWLASLGALPALGVAPAPWRQSPAALAEDLGFHLVYGAATAAAYEALTA